MCLSFLLAMNLWIEPLKLCFFRNSFFQVLKWIWTASRFRRFPMSTRSFCWEKFPGFSEGILSLVGRGSRSTVLASLEVKCKIKAAPIVMLPLYKRRLFRARHSFLVLSLEPITNTVKKYEVMIRSALFLSLSHIKCPNAREIWRLSVCNRFDVFLFLFVFINMSTCSIFSQSWCELWWVSAVYWRLQWSHVESCVCRGSTLNFLANPLL